ncbi:M48 family metallopeptidase [Curvivirga sp.]|uniref:M48 family metallopeptidase n=1 Tax=Curvivirga sp. TaxID=2856848 RepID=UPI003B5BA02E
MLELLRSSSKKSLETDRLALKDGQEVIIRFKVNARAKRLILKYDTAEREVVVTLPKGVSQRQAWRFVDQYHEWIETQISKQEALIEVHNGVLLYVEGIEYKITHDPEAGRSCRLTEESLLIVGGPEEHMPRRVMDFLKKKAKERFKERVDYYTDQLGVQHRRISIRDTKSRWGSCASDGSLNFSWRLIMAPRYVLDYVVAHEVAHIREHNHSSAFWAIVEELDPEWRKSRDWLHQHGGKLHAVTFN